MSNAPEFVVNGERLRINELCPNTTLLEFLRSRGLTGAKEGCAEGDCGACTVIVREQAPGKTTWRAINSCIVPAALLAGRDIVTVEGIANRGGDLHCVQRAMVEHHGSQCGYCTPGFICSLFEAYHREDLNTSWQIDDQLCGNLCRCTGYWNIIEAVEAAASAARDGASADAAERDAR